MAAAELYIDRGDGDENTCIYDQLHKQKAAIENAFGGELTWEPLEGKRACRIKAEQPGNLFVRNRWPAMIDFMTGAMVRMEWKTHSNSRLPRSITSSEAGRRRPPCRPFRPRSRQSSSSMQEGT